MVYVFLQVSKEDVDKYPSVAGHNLISCQVKVEWVGDEMDSFSHFRYEVEFHGARDYYLAVRLPSLYFRELQMCNNLLIYVSGGGNPFISVLYSISIWGNGHLNAYGVSISDETK